MILKDFEALKQGNPKIVWNRKFPGCQWLTEFPLHLNFSLQAWLIFDKALGTISFSKQESSKKSWLSQTEIQEFIFFSQRTFHLVFYVQRTYYNDFARIHKQGLYPCRKDLDSKKERCWMPFLGNKAQSKSLCCSLMVVLSMSRSISRCTIFFLTRGSKASCSLWESTYGLRRLSLEERKMLLLLLLLLMAPLYFVCVPHWNGFLMILISTFCETLLRLNIAFEAFYTPKTKYKRGINRGVWDGCWWLFLRKVLLKKHYKTIEEEES